MRSLFFTLFLTYFVIHQCQPMDEEETTTQKKQRQGGTTNIKKGPIEVYDDKNTIVQFYVKTRLYDAKDKDKHSLFNVDGLLKYRNALDPDDEAHGIVSKEDVHSFIDQYIARENEKVISQQRSIDKLIKELASKKKKKKKDDNEKIKRAKERLLRYQCWLEFYRYLKENWRLFVFLDLLYPLLDGSINGISFIERTGNTLVGTAGTFPDVKPGPYKNARSTLHDRVIEICNNGIIHDKRKGNTTFIEPRFRVYSVLFDENTGDTVFKSIKDKDSKTGGGFYTALTAINRTISVIRIKGLLMPQQPQRHQEEEGGGESIVVDVDEPVIVTRMVPSKSVKRTEPTLTETGETIGKEQTIGSTKRQIAFHPRLIVFLAQVARTNEGFESLPYMVEYVHKMGDKEKTGKMKKIKKREVMGEEEEEVIISYRSNKNLIKLLSICAHQRSIELIELDGGDDIELDVLYDGTMPLFSPYRRIIDRITNPSQLPDTYTDLFISSVLSPQFYAQFWTRVIHMIQSCLMGIDSGLSITGTPMVISRKIANLIHQKLVDINEYLETDGGLVYVGYERIMNETIVHSFFIVTDDDDDDDMLPLIMMLPWSEWSFDEIKTSCINQVIGAINVGSTRIYSKKTSGVLESSMKVLLQSVKLENIKAEIETRCFTLTGTDALTQKPIHYVNIDTNRSLSPCDLLAHYMRHANTPKERAKVTRLLNLFSSLSIDDTRVDARTLYSSIQSIFEGHVIRTHYSLGYAMRYSDLESAEHLIDSMIGLGPRFVYHDETSMNSLTKVTSYRIMTDHMSGQGIKTVLIFRDIYEWPVMSNDLSSDMDAMFKDGLVQCIVEHRKNDRTTELRKIALSRITPIDHVKLGAEKQLVVNQALKLSMGSIERCDVVVYQKETWFIVVSGSNNDTRKGSSLEARRVISLMENYDRLSKRVQSPLDNILDGGIIPVREMDDDDDQRVIEYDPNVAMHDETGDAYGDDDDEKKEYISSKFNQLRSLVYMSRLDLDVFYLGKLVVPLVHRRSRLVVMTRLIDVIPGLFGGTLSLQGIATEDQTIVQVSVEKLILDMSKEISLRMTMREIRRLFEEGDD